MSVSEKWHSERVCGQVTPRWSAWLDLCIACSSSVNSMWIRESSTTKPNTDSTNYVGQLSRPQLSTCNSFHFQSLVVEFLESCRQTARTPRSCLPRSPMAASQWEGGLFQLNLQRQRRILLVPRGNQL